MKYRSSYDPHTLVHRPATLTDSKIGGAPYRPKGAGWPIDPDGQAFNFVAQLNLEQVEQDRVSAGIPPLLGGALPTSGLVQFFLPFDDAYGLGTGDPIFFVAFIPDCSGPADDPVFAWQPYLDSPLVWKSEDPDPERRDKNPHFAKKGIDYWDFARSPLLDTDMSILNNPEVPQKLELIRLEPASQAPFPDRHIEAFQADSLHQVGGAPHFVQSDPRPQGTNLQLLFQIDGVAPMLWIGDGGIMQFFIDPADLARRDFSKMLMDWACF